MYFHRHNETEGLAVWYFYHQTVTDFDVSLEHARTLATWHAKIGKRAAVVLFPGDFKRPDAQRRAELIRVTESPGYNPYIAFVAPNAVVRTLLSMFGWLQKSPKYEMNFVGSAEQGVAWLESQRGTKLDLLSKMIQEVAVEFKQATGLEIG